MNEQQYPIAANRTFKIDNVTSTKLDWAIMFLKELGIPAPAQRAILSRALDFYVEYLEELVVTHNCKPKAKELREEVHEVMILNKERNSVWTTPELPRINLESYGCFPKYRDLAKSYINPIKPLPRIRKPRKQEVSFKELQSKRSTNPPTTQA